MESKHSSAKTMIQSEKYLLGIAFIATGCAFVSPPGSFVLDPTFYYIIITISIGLCLFLLPGFIRNLVPASAFQKYGAILFLASILMSTGWALGFGVSKVIGGFLHKPICFTPL